MRPLLQLILSTSIALFFFAPTTVHGQWQSILPQLEETVKERMQSENITGMSVAVFTRDSVVYARGFGYADREARQWATDSTIYLIGSVTKLLTSTMVMQAADRDSLSVDAEVSRYLPSFKPSLPNDSNVAVTISSILTHQSGLPSDILSGIIRSELPGQIDVASQLNETYLAYPPGYIYSYSNAAYSLLGQMLENIYGTSYHKLLQEQLFGLMGMRHTFTERAMKREQLISATYDENGSPAPELTFRDVAAGGVYSNVQDMARFGQMMLREGEWNNQQLLQPRTARECLRIQNKRVKIRTGKHMGYGWMIDYGNHAGKIAWHNGANIHFRSMFAIAPELDMGIVFLANSDNASSLATNVFHWLDQIGKEMGHRSQFYPPHSPAFIPQRYERIRPADSFLQQYTGTYSRSGLLFNIEQKCKKLILHIRDRRLELLPLEDGYFMLQGRAWWIFPTKAKDMRVEFEQVDSFTIAHQVRANGHRELFGTKLEPQPISPTWKKRMGHYEVINKQPGEKVMLENPRITMEHGFLVIKGTELFKNNEVTYAIKPIHDNLGKLMGLGRGTGDYVHFEKQKGGEVLQFLGYEMRKVDTQSQ